MYVSRTSALVARCSRVGLRSDALRFMGEDTQVGIAYCSRRRSAHNARAASLRKAPASLELQLPRRLGKRDAERSAVRPRTTHASQGFHRPTIGLGEVRFRDPGATPMSVFHRLLFGGQSRKLCRTHCRQRNGGQSSRDVWSATPPRGGGNASNGAEAVRA